MPPCQICGTDFQWSLLGDRWVPLEPIGHDADLVKKYVDEAGNLRADHRDRCQDPAIRITKLSVPVHPIEGTDDHENFVQRMKRKLRA